MMQIATQDGAVYSLEHRRLGAAGRVLAISRTGGTDDPPLTNAPMDAGRWYHVSVLTPLPPAIGQHLEMILDPVADDLSPIVRRTGMVTSVVGLVEDREPGAEAGGSVPAAVPVPGTGISYAADDRVADRRGGLAGVLDAILPGRARR